MLTKGLFVSSYVMRSRQRGVVLMITLIVLVAMTLAGIALIRSVDTTNIIAGNLAFQQAATHSGDTGTETAIDWLELNNTGNTLWCNPNDCPLGYSATRDGPAIGQSWDNYWTTTLDPPLGPSLVVTLATDAAGNTVSYMIHRLCNQKGDPTAALTGCAVSTSSTTSTGGSMDAGAIALTYSSQRYYRITSRIVGPRNTVSYVQAIVAM